MLIMLFSTLTSTAVQAIIAYNHGFFSPHVERLRDRLYCADTQDRQNAQTVLFYSFQNMVSMLAPVCPLTADAFWDYAPEGIKLQDGELLQNIYRSGWFNPPKEWNDLDIKRDFKDLNKSFFGGRVRSAELAINDEELNVKNIKDLATLFKVEAGSEAEKLLTKYDMQTMYDYFGGHIEVVCVLPDHIGEDWKWTAKFSLRDTDVLAYAVPPANLRCDRCWRYTATLPEGDTLDKKAVIVCQRCEDVIDNLIED